MGTLASGFMGNGVICVCLHIGPCTTVHCGRGCARGRGVYVKGVVLLVMDVRGGRGEGRQRGGGGGGGGGWGGGGGGQWGQTAEVHVPVSRRKLDLVEFVDLPVPVLPIAGGSSARSEMWLHNRRDGSLHNASITHQECSKRWLEAMAGLCKMIKQQQQQQHQDNECEMQHQLHITLLHAYTEAAYKDPARCA